MYSTDFSNYNEILSFDTNFTYFSNYSNYIWQFLKSWWVNDCYALTLICPAVLQLICIWFYIYRHQLQIGKSIVLRVGCSLTGIMYKRYKRFGRMCSTFVLRIYPKNLKVIVLLLKCKFWEYFEEPWTTS